jgi:hypothetical protein
MLIMVKMVLFLMKIDTCPSMVTLCGIISLLLLLSCLSGCVQTTPGLSTDGTSPIPPTGDATQDAIAPEVTVQATSQVTSAYPLALTSEKITVTVHSVERVSRLWDYNPYEGNVFLVVDATIRNNQENRDFRFTEEKISISEGGDIWIPSITHTMGEGMVDPFVECILHPKAERRGYIVFGVYANAGDFSLRLVDGLGNELLSADLPADPRDQSAAGSGENSPQYGKALDATVHSAIKTKRIQDFSSSPGYEFIIVNITLENLAERDSYMVTERCLDMSGADWTYMDLSNALMNPLYWSSIPPKETRTGEVVFNVREGTESFTLSFLDDFGRVVLEKELGSVPCGYYAPFLENPDLIGSDDFEYVLESLDSPAKAAQYANTRFTFNYHTGCIPYPPAEFFRIKKGDCKDYAAFLSFVFAHHGYDAKSVRFKYSTNGVIHGHVVTLFKDADGILKYSTTPDVRIFREVTSVEDLLEKESYRLGADSIEEYHINPADSADCSIE